MACSVHLSLALRRSACGLSVTMRSVFRRGGFQKLLGVFFKFRQAVTAAEVIGLAAMNVTARSAIGLHIHAADWIDHLTTSLSEILKEFLRCDLPPICVLGRAK